MPDGDVDAALDKDDEMWDPEDDSDYDDAPKKKQKKKSGSSKKEKASGQRKKQRSDWPDDSCSDSDEDVAQNRSKQQQEKTAKAAGVALRSVKAAINKQLVYRRGLKPPADGSSRVSLELPCLSEAIVAAMIGPQLMPKASNGKKQLQLKASNDDLAVMYGDGYYSPFCKSLRYGATLELVNGLTFTFNKTTAVLKVHGSFTMME